MGKKLAWLAAAACLAWLVPAWALSLGGIRIHSRLNQPLTASILLVAAPGEVLDENVKVRLASNEEYARAGLERLDFLSDLNFVIEGNRVVVSSRRSAREPVMDLLVEVLWAGGRMLRQYTVLLDPEGVGPAPAPLEPAAQSSTAPPPTGGTAARNAPPPRASAEANVGGTRGRRPAETAAAGTPPLTATPSYRPSEAPRSATSATRPRTYGPIKPSETPTSVASKLRPDDSVSVEQMIIALFQWNPTAFGSTLSTFRPGAVLRVPDAEVVRRVDPQIAKARIAEARASAEPAEEPRPATPPNLTPTPAAETAVQPTPEPKLETVQPKPAPTPAPAPPTATPETPAPAPEAAAPTSSDAVPAPSATESTGTAEAPAPVAEPAAPAPAEPNVSRRKRGGGIGDWLLPVGLIVAALILIAIIWRLVRRPKSIGDDFPSVDMGTLATARAGAGAARTAAAPEPRFEEVAPAPFREPAPAAAPPPPSPRATTPEPEIPPAPETAAAPPAAPRPAAKPSFADTALTDTRQIDLEGGDALAEADFHLAYGLYDEAILLLTQAITRDPARTDVRTKLAEAYFSANRGQEFMETARTLKDQLDPSGWEKIAVLGRQLFPSEPLFGGVGGAAPAAPAGETATAAPRRAADSLAFEMPKVEAPAAAPPASAKAAETGSIPFELGSLNLDTPISAAEAGASAEGVDLESRVNLDDPALGGDEATTKLDLARAYIDLGDNDMARGLLGEVIQQGSTEQRQTAEELMRKLPA